MSRFRHLFSTRLVVVVSLLVTLFNLRALAQPSPAAAFDAANRLYEQGKFREAALSFEKLVQTGRVSEPLYFNWGNALFKSGQIGRAIDAYYRAAQMAPRDPDLRANLQFARNQVQGPTLLPERPSRWLGKLSLDEWTWLAAGCLWAWLLLLAWMQLRPALRPALKSYALWSGIVTAAVCAGFAGELYFTRFDSRAIVIAPEIIARQAPLEESQKVDTLHDGAELRVLDQKDQWLQVQIDARRTGWVPKEAVLRPTA